MPPPSFKNGCPNYSGPVFGSDATAATMIWVECITTQCRFWDSTAEKCSMEVLGDIRNELKNMGEDSDVTDGLEDIHNELKDIRDDLEVIHVDIDGIHNLDKHVHYSHYHEKPHESANAEIINGSSLTKSIPSASSLISEKQGNEDIDGNGYIFGKDFFIDPDDPDLPEMLKKIPVTDSTSIVIISWQDYIDSTSPFSINVVP